MTGRGGPDGRPAPPSRRRIAAYRHAAARPPVAAQVGQVRIDLAALSVLTARGNPLARGAALALAHGALKLAVTPAAAAADRRSRAEVLRGTVLPALAGAGLGHVAELVEAALAHGGDPARVGRGTETRQ